MGFVRRNWPIVFIPPLISTGFYAIGLHESAVSVVGATILSWLLIAGFYRFCGIKL